MASLMGVARRRGIAAVVMAVVVSTVAAPAAVHASPASATTSSTPAAAAVDSAKGAAQLATAREAWTEQNAASAALVAAQTQSTGATALVDAVDVTSGGSTTSDSSSGTGTYTATPLAPAASWTQGGSSGSFDWSYPFTVPAPAAGSAPTLGIDYDSSSVDGRTAITNNQTSVVGEGFDITSSYIERTYLDCDQAGLSGKHDLCWHGEQLDLVLNGQSNALVPTGANTFKLATDDGSTVQRLTGTTNGDNDGEYWRLTTADGTRYLFGMNQLPGWSPGDPETNSTWTVPVYTNGSGVNEATCTSGAAFCQQGWRWNLDLVEDLNGNAQTYWYTAETNRYARAGTTGTDYDRGGYLTEIDYGLRANNLFDTTSKTAAPYQVDLDYAERCLAAASDCSADDLTSATKSRWPDVPFSAICDSGDCTSNPAPTFFTRKRLTTVTTKVADTSASSGYRPIDTWDLTQTWYNPSDSTDTFDNVLWLSSIQHTGHGSDGTSQTTPAVDLTPSGQSMENRVDTTGDGLPPLDRPRLGTITNEVGGVTTVDYSSVQCDPNNLPTGDAIATNTQRCFPVYWAPYGGTPKADWFNKYVVDSVSQDDTTTGDIVTTSYDYLGGGAWRYDDDPQVPNKYRTWSDWRGYGEVDTLLGRSDGQRTLTANYYFRGMDGNQTASGGSQAVSITGADAPRVTDADPYEGMTYESVLYDGESADGTKGAKVSETINTPWSHTTASATLPGGPIGGDAADPVPLDANQVATQTTVNRTFIYGSPFTTAASRSTTTKVDSFDSYGMPNQTDAWATPDDGSPATHTDPTCTSLTYARNTSANLLTPIARTLVQSVACAGADSAALPADATTPGSVTSDTITTYDDAPKGSWASQAPTAGNATATYRVAGYDSGRNPILAANPTTATSYDALGRVLTVADAEGNTTTTAYTPAGAGVPQTTAVTDAAGHTTTTTWDPARMQALSVVDPNGKPTTETYDDLGRLTAVWEPNASQAQGQAASEKFAYHLGGAKNSDGTVTGSWVATYTPQGGSASNGYNMSYQVYDALYRARQTQTPSTDGGQILTDTEYDDRGNVATSFANDWDSSDSPNGTRFVVAHGGADQTDNAYDGANRLVNSTESWTVPTPGTCTVNSTRCSRATTTTYTGDATFTVPPAGGNASATETDALGRTVETVTYPARTITDPSTGKLTLAGTIDNVTAYDPQGRVASVTGRDGLATTYKYDLYGRTVSSTDPAAGTSTSTYNDLDQVATTTNARGMVLSYTYDSLGRKTAEFSGADTGNQANEQSSWSYDAAGQLGQLSSSTRYVGGKGQANSQAYTTTINTYDSLYRPTKTTVTLPSTDPLVSGAKLPATYTTTESYNKDGGVNTIGDPSIAGLPAETETYGYDNAGLGLQTTLNGTQGVVLATGYTPTGQIANTNLGTSGTSSNQVSFAYTYDGLDRLTNFETTDPTSSGPHLINAAYTYNDADQVTHVFDTGDAGNTEYQCYSYGDFGRLATEWTPSTASCTTSTQASSNIGGAAPYWKDFTYSPNGRRTQRVDHAYTAGPAKDSTYTYAYGATCNNVDQSARVLTGVTKVSGSTTTTSAYCVNADGQQTTSATLGGYKRSTSWTAENQVATLGQVTSTGTTVRSDYLYDADGNLLIERPDSGAAGTTVLYLGDTEIDATQAADGTWTLKGLRYYTSSAGTVAIRTGVPGQTSTLNFLAADQQGTTNATWSASAPGTTRTKRWTDAYGSPVGSPDWPDTRRFLGKPWDATSVISDLGARFYDPQTGRFLSVDSVLDTSDPTSVESYGYADEDPVNNSDPNGTQCRQDAPGTSLPCGEVMHSPPPSSQVSQQTSSASQNSADQQRQQILDNYENGAANAELQWAVTQSELAATAGPRLPSPGFLQSVGDIAEGAGLSVVHDFTQCRVNSLSGGAHCLGAAVDISGVLDFGLSDELRAGIAVGTVGDSTALAASAGAELPEGYSSFSAAKRAMGSPGEGNVFDHVVEQSQIGRSGFAPEEIHNPFNMNSVSARTNQIKANYYSSKQPFTGGGTVRDWLTGQSFADQYSFGMDVLTQIRRGVIQ